MFRTAGIYVVGAWLVMQVADVFFPAWGLPDAALNALLAAAVLGLPLALIFGWFYDVTAHGIVRTRRGGEAEAEAPLPLQRFDYLILAALALIAGWIGYETVGEILEAPRSTEERADAIVEPPPLDKPDNSIAVLPFSNISDDPDNEFFCDGISEEILNRLSGFEELLVIARTSSFSFKNSDYRAPRISDLLGTRYLLQGSVRKHGDRLRISAQLVDEKGVQQWAETYDRTLADVFAIQSEIAEIVSKTVAPRIVGTSAPGYEPSIEAYEHYLAGRELVRQRQNPEAIGRLEAALAIDPDYAEAWAELAVAFALQGVRASADSLDRGWQAAEQALALRPGLARALAAQGLLLQDETDPDWAASEPVLRRALAADPNMVDAMNWLGNALHGQSKHAEAAALLERAYRIDPLHPVIVANVARAYMERGETERAERMLLRLVGMHDTGFTAFLQLRDYYASTGRITALIEISKREALSSVARHYYGLALGYAVLGMEERSKYWNDRFARDFPDFWFSGYNLANIPMWRGDYGEAVRIFEEQMAQRGRTLADLGRFHAGYHGQNLALAGDYEAAVQALTPLFEPGSGIDDVESMEFAHALAWAHQKLGEDERAASLLEQAATGIAEMLESLAYDNSYLSFQHALNALLRGDTGLALDRLERAVEIGWRFYPVVRNDPRLASLVDEPRYRALMATVVADLERQRAEVERHDDFEAFVAAVDEARARDD